MNQWLNIIIPCQIIGDFYMAGNTVNLKTMAYCPCFLFLADYLDIYFHLTSMKNIKVNKWTTVGMLLSAEFAVRIEKMIFA